MWPVISVVAIAFSQATQPAPSSRWCFDRGQGAQRPPSFVPALSSLSPIEAPAGPTGSAQHRKQFGSDKDFDAARDARLPPDQPSSFESEHHLVDRGRTNAKVPLEIGFGGRSAEDARIGIDERQTLTLLWRETQDRR